jgi:L-asparagine oxygenase
MTLQLDHQPDAVTREVLSLSLSDHDRTVVGALTDELTADPDALIDENRWLARARELSCHLPPALREVVRRFRRDSGDEGVLLVRGMPLGPVPLPATPSARDSVQRRPSHPAVAHVLTSMQLGELIAFRNEKGGALVQDVVPVPGREDVQGNAGSVALKMHTENAFHPGRPDYVSLMCLRADHDNVAALRTSSVRRALELLPRRTREILAEPRFVTHAPPSFGEGAPAQGTPVLAGDPADPDLRVDFAATDPLDVPAADALEDLGRALDEARRTFPLQPGDLAVVDNRIAVHGRTSFRPRYDGLDRWLQRTYVQLDLRRSRPARPGDGNVLN